jgi:hypothetical protein
MPRKTYLRPPNDDYAPGNNIQLGCVWRDPRDPGSFIGAPIKLHKNIKINHNHKGAWVKDLGKKSSGFLGLLSKISLLPVQASMTAHFEEVEDGKYTIPTMDTDSIEPTPAYVKSSIKSVSQEMLKSGASLYMITGTKIARGGQGSTTESSNIGFDNRVGIDASAVNAPVSIGEQAGFSRESHNNEQFGPTGDFVFAYRVRRIWYEKGTLKTEEYNKGAVMGEESTRVSAGASDIVYEVTEAEIDDEDVSGGGEVYLCVDEGGDEWDLVL